MDEKEAERLLKYLPELQKLMQDRMDMQADVFTALLDKYLPYTAIEQVVNLSIDAVKFGFFMGAQAAFDITDLAKKSEEKGGSNLH